MYALTIEDSQLEMSYKQDKENSSVSHIRILACAEGDIAERLRNVGEVKCIAASSDGRLLGVGTGDGALAVLEVPSMRTKAEIKCAHRVLGLG